MFLTDLLQKSAKSGLRCPLLETITCYKSNIPAKLWVANRCFFVIFRKNTQEKHFFDKMI